MIVSIGVPDTGLGGLGFSLLPSKKSRAKAAAAARKIGQALNLNVHVQTPAGPVDLNTSDPNSFRRAAQAARDTLSRTSVTVGPRQEPAPSGAAGAADSVRDFVENRVPGGWLTAGVVGFALAIAVAKATRGGRR